MEVLMVYATSKPMGELVVDAAVEQWEAHPELRQCVVKLGVGF